MSAFDPIAAIRALSHPVKDMDRGRFWVRKCALSGVEAVEAASGLIFSRHTHDAFGIGRIIEGGQRSWSGRGAVEARKGDIITSNAGEVHDGSPLGEWRSWKILYASPRRVADIVLDIEEGRSAELEFQEPVFERSPNAQRFERCYAAMTGPQCEPLAAEAALIVLLDAMLVRSRSTHSPARMELRRAKERIDCDPVTPLCLADLARESGLSKYQSLRGFTRLTGLPPHAYQTQRRLELARAMIARGSSLSEAATAAGFADQSHLHRTFVRRFGITPGGYAAAVR